MLSHVLSTFYSGLSSQQKLYPITMFVQLNIEITHATRTIKRMKLFEVFTNFCLRVVTENKLKIGKRAFGKLDKIKKNI